MPKDTNATVPPRDMPRDTLARVLRHAEALHPSRWRGILEGALRRALTREAHPRRDARLRLLIELLVRANALDLLREMVRQCDPAIKAPLLPVLARLPSPMRRLLAHQADLPAGARAAEHDAPAIRPHGPACGLGVPNPHPPGLSLVVVVHGRVFQAHRLFASLRALPSGAPLEILVFVNGGHASWDVVLRGLLGPGADLRVFHSETAVPVGVARNRLVAAARHGTIVSLDSDMVLLQPADRLVRHLDSFPTAPRAQVWNLGYLGIRDLEAVKLLKHIEASGDPPTVLRNRSGLNLSPAAFAQMEGEVLVANRVSAGASIFPKRVFQDLGGFSSEFDLGWEDLELSLRLAASGRLVLNEIGIGLFHGHFAPFAACDLETETRRFVAARREPGLAVLRRAGWQIRGAEAPRGPPPPWAEEALRASRLKLRLVQDIGLPVLEVPGNAPVVGWVAGLEELADGPLRALMQASDPALRSIVLTGPEIGTLERLAASLFGVDALVIGARSLDFLASRQEAFPAAFTRLQGAFTAPVVVVGDATPQGLAALRKALPAAGFPPARPEGPCGLLSAVLHGGAGRFLASVVPAGESAVEHGPGHPTSEHKGMARMDARPTDGRQGKPAEEDRLKALGIAPTDIERVIFGRRSSSFDIDKIAWLAAAVSSSEYAGAHMRHAKRFRSRGDMLAEGVRRAKVEGLIGEFGVRTGSTIRTIAKHAPEQTIYGFDGFEGIPEDWKPGSVKGSYGSAAIPEVPANVQLVIGWFEDTLPGFVREHKDKKFRFMHIDSDVYSSARTVFDRCREMIVPGTVIQFDEYMNYPHWQRHEWLAFQEFIAATGLSYKYVGLIAHDQQVLVEILG